MELEMMFAEQKWNIIKCLSEEKYSPIQLAEKLGTTMANISQQLRMLQATNLVKKEKIKNRDKGKPRALFSLNNEYMYVISTMNHFADKRLLPVQSHQKIILKIWFLQNVKLQLPLERLFWEIEPYLSEINELNVHEEKGEVMIVSTNPEVIKKKLGKSYGIPIAVLSIADAQRKYKSKLEGWVSLYAMPIPQDGGAPHNAS